MPQARTVATSDDRRVVSYRLGRRIATAGDLNQAITLARSERAPDTATDATGYVQVFRGYMNTWASVLPGEEKIVGGEDNDDKSLTVFTIRNPGDAQIESEDYVIWGTKMFNVASTQVIGNKQRFLVIRGRPFGSTDGVMFDNGASRGPTTVVEPQKTGDIFWEQLK